MTTCHERREQIYLYAAGVLENDERAELETHLGSGCPRCNEALAEERESLGAVALALVPVVPPARVRDRLLARIREGARRVDPGTRQAPRVRRRELARLAGFAGVALGAAALTFGIAWWQLGSRPAQERAPTAADGRARAPGPAAAAGPEEAALREQLAEQDRELADLEAQVDAAAEISRLLGARGLEVLDLAAPEPGADAWGRAFWDPDYHCYFRAHGLAPLPAGHSYVLWMVGPGERVHAAGTLERNGAGDAALYTRLPRELSPIVRSVVTDEPVPYGEHPTGPTLLVGESRAD